MTKATKVLRMSSLGLIALGAPLGFKSGSIGVNSACASGAETTCCEAPKGKCCYSTECEDNAYDNGVGKPCPDS